MQEQRQQFPKIQMNMEKSSTLLVVVVVVFVIVQNKNNPKNEYYSILG